LSKVNPYCAGSGRRPRILAGRSRQLAIVENLANQFEGRRPAENVVWTGLRGMGKTVLLRESLDHFHDRGWLAGYHEVRRNPGIGASVASIVLQGNAVLGRGKLAKSLAWLRELVGSATVSTAAGDLTFKLGLAPAKDGSLPEDALDVLFVRLGEAAADAGVGAVLLFDELQLIARDDLSALLHAAQAAESLPIAFIAAGLPDLPGAMASAGSYAERLYYDRVDWLSAEDVRQAIVVPAAEFEVTYEPEALELLVRHVASYPHFAQLYPEEAWKVAGTPSDRPGHVITVGDVLGALEPAQVRLDEGLYQIRLQKASDAERAYLVAMAGLADARIPSGDVARRLGRKAQEASPLRERLIQKGIIYSPAHNVVEFAVPGFATYLRRTQGAETPPGAGAPAV
jgi:AAA ATPase-like protein